LDLTFLRACGSFFAGGCRLFQKITGDGCQFTPSPFRFYVDLFIRITKKKSSVMISGRAARASALFLVRASQCCMISSAGPINPVDLICNVLRLLELPQSGLRKERFF